MERCISITDPRFQTFCCQAEHLAIMLRLAHRAVRRLRRIIKGHDCPREGQEVRYCVRCRTGSPTCNYCEVEKALDVLEHGDFTLFELSQDVGSNADISCPIPARLARLERIHARMIRAERGIPAEPVSAAPSNGALTNGGARPVPR